MKEDGELPRRVKVRSSQYLNNLIEQDHRRVKQRIRPMLGFKRFDHAVVTISGIELAEKIKKGGAADKAASFSGVGVPVSSIACFGRLAYPMHVKVTRHVLLGRRRHRLLRRELCGGSDQGGKQTERPEHKEMAATSKRSSAGKSLERVFTVRRPMTLLGKADVAGEATGACNLSTVVVGAQASQERLAEITSGRTRRQQGLVATCKDSRNEALAEGGESQTGMAHESIGAMTEEQCLPRRRHTPPPRR